jgi:hypothetical protein
MYRYASKQLLDKTSSSMYPPPPTPLLGLLALLSNLMTSPNLKVKRLPVCAENVTIISLPYYVKDNQMSARYPHTLSLSNWKSSRKKSPIFNKRAQKLCKKDLKNRKSAKNGSVTPKCRLIYFTNPGIASFAAKG